MAEEKTVTETPAAAPEPARTIENPMMSWMRGGTLTSAYEAELAKQEAAAEAARGAEAKRAKIVAANPHEAKQHMHSLGGNKSHAGIVLEVRHPKDQVVLDYIDCELNVDTDGSLFLVLACWKCYHRTGRASNITVHQNHRHFELDTRRQGELWVNPRNPQHIVTLAGTIHTTEAITCPNLGCGCRFVIDNSVVREK